MGVQVLPNRLWKPFIHLLKEREKKIPQPTAQGCLVALSPVHYFSLFLFFAILPPRSAT